MPAVVTATVRGKDRLYQKLRKLAPVALAKVGDAGVKAANDMRDMAYRLAPTGRTGKLRESIAVTPAGGQPPDYGQGVGGIGVVPPGAVAVTVGDNAVRYAHLVEFGTPPHIVAGLFEGDGLVHPGTPPRPFFWPAYRAMRRGFNRKTSTALRKAIDEVGKQP